MKVKCPRCNSDDFDLGDYQHHHAYDDVVDSISATQEKYRGFSVWAYCKKCRYVFYINFSITSITPTEARVDEDDVEIDEVR